MASGHERETLAREVTARALAVKEAAAALPPSSQAASLRAAIEALMVSVAQLESAV